MMKLCTLKQPAMCSRATRIQETPIANSEKCEECEYAKVVCFAEFSPEGESQNLRLITL
jgi:hypothetical protein